MYYWRIMLARVFLFLSLVLASVGLTAQTVPVRIENVSQKTDDVAKRMVAALENSISISGHFTLFTGIPYKLPKDGVLIFVKSTEIKNDSGTILGSSLIVSSHLQSATDRRYIRTLTEYMLYIPAGNPVSDEALSFLADTNAALQAPGQPVP
jgi:hypothetical protein